MLYRRLTFAAREIAGAFADMGTLLPLMLGLIACNGIDARSALAVVGLAYILVGVYFRLPISVQPMKALAMIAITSGMTSGQIRAAACWMAVILLVLGVTRLADKLSDVFPKLLIHVLQLNLGIMMVRTGGSFLLSYPSRLADLVPGVNHFAGHAVVAGFLPSILDFQTALIILVIPQLPLTLGNAMLATRDCALKYFGPRGGRVTPSRLAISMGLGNAASALVSGMPICHGAGGMTAHYRLGARTGAAGAIVGSALLAVGIWKGDSASALLSMIPAAVLGILLAYVGVRHALLAGDSLRNPATACILLLTGIAGWFSGNLLVPLGVGIVASFLTASLLRLRKNAAEAAS